MDEIKVGLHEVEAEILVIGGATAGPTDSTRIAGPQSFWNSRETRELPCISMMLR